MTETKPSLLAQIKSYPATFWVANTMEIFERMAWYGWFTVMALYVTGTVETGGLGFTTETRGVLQAVVPFFLYLMPVLTGALADRYGYKKMFIIAYLVMIAAYYSLGQFTSLPTFFLAFMFVAVGAAIFKPVVVGTVARVTDESNSSTAFGIFYMMVNIGGFVGPIVAGVVRGKGWDWVFVACSFWAFCNLLIVLFFYKEPTTEAASGSGRSLSKVLDNLVEVLGNLRFFIAVIVILVLLMVTSTLQSLHYEWATWPRCWIAIAVWLVLNFVYDNFLPKGSGRPTAEGEVRRNPLAKRMYCSNWRFALYLLILSGFWTSFNQIFYTMPEYIRDFTNTRPLIDAAEGIFGKADVDRPNEGIASDIATINDLERAEILKEVKKAVEEANAGTLDTKELDETARTLLDSKVRIAPERILALVSAPGADPEKVTDQMMFEGRQVNPEFIVNIDAGAIVLFQVLVSFLMGRFHRFTTMIVGMVVAAVGIGLSAFAGDDGMLGHGGSVWIVLAGIFIFAFGEMMASPTSQEYVGRIAPKDRVALYMGYYFVAVALGNLFGGILSGQLYGKLARDMGRPDLMWGLFGGIMLATAIIFLLYDRFALPRSGSNAMVSEEA